MAAVDDSDPGVLMSCAKLFHIWGPWFKRDNGQTIRTCLLCGDKMLMTNHSSDTSKS